MNKSLTIHPLSIVCKDAELSGAISIGEGTVIHPKCNIESSLQSGGIEIGKYNIIEEGVQIVNYSKNKLIIGDYNRFRSGAIIQCKQIGNDNLVKQKGFSKNSLY